MGRQPSVIHAFSRADQAGQQPPARHAQIAGNRRTRNEQRW